MNRIFVSCLSITLFIGFFGFVLPFSGNVYSQENAIDSEKNVSASSKRLVYIVSDNSIPFWDVMGRGAKKTARSLGFNLDILDAKNSAQLELQLTVKAINDHVTGIIISPSNSSACVTVLKLAKEANIPVVISDVGSDSGEYVSYISSDNRQGGYQIGLLLVKKLQQKKWHNGSVGIIAIPQKRLNGQARTAGFMSAMSEHNIEGAGIRQLDNWSEKETYQFTKDFIRQDKNIRAIWLQTSNIYRGALRAINELGKQNDILLVAFDAEPEFVQLITEGKLIGSAMQQPYLMGQKSVHAMVDSLQGKAVIKNQQQPILIISTENISEKFPQIKTMVLGIE